MSQSRTTFLLTGLIALAGLLAAPGANAADIDVAALWSKNCSVCHGKDAKGDTKAGKNNKVSDLTDPAVKAKFDRARMIKGVKEGIKDETTGKDRMKPFAGKLDDAQIAALIDWVIALK